MWAYKWVQEDITQPVSKKKKQNKTKQKKKTPKLMTNFWPTQWK